MEVRLSLSIDQISEIYSKIFVKRLKKKNTFDIKLKLESGHLLCNNQVITVAYARLL